MAHGQIAKDKTTISLVIPKDLKERLFEIATKENRSASSLMVALFDNYVSIYEDKKLLSEYNNLSYKAKEDKSK